MILTATMSALLTTCAPNVGVKTMAGVVQYESGWQPYAIGDNTTRHSYYPTTRDEALETETYLLGLGHNLDVGLSQVNSENFAAYGLAPATALDSCRNLHAGSAILAEAYSRALRTNWTGAPIRTRQDVYLQQQESLVHALSAYNTGGFFAGMGYARNVYDIAAAVQIDFPFAPAIHRDTAYEPKIRSPLHHAKKPRTTKTQIFRPAWNDQPSTSAIQILGSKAESQP
jgi:type IV secretion system protein VirB1